MGSGCACVAVVAGGGTTRLKLLKFAVGVGTGCAWCGRRLRRDLVSDESLEAEETGMLGEGMGWGALWWWWLW